MPARHRGRLLIAIGAAAVALSLAAGPAAASPPPGFDGSTPLPPDPNPAGPATEATIVDMIHTSGLFGGDVPSATAQTPYPTGGLEDQRTVTTAQIVLDDPAGETTDPILTYCIDLDTETTIGIHYELGQWTEANVPNLQYVQWILENHYPQNPAAPAGGTDAEKVRAVQGAIWYFTDQFVVAPAYPAERSAVASIVAAAQAAVGPTPTPPALPTLEITPGSIDASVPGEIVGPFAVGGSVSAATLELDGTTVYADAAGTIPVPAGATVTPGTQLWALFDPAVSGQGFALSATATVPAGNVFLYDGNNPPRTTAQSLVLAADIEIPLRAAATIVAEAAGTLDVAVTISGSAAGAQSRIDLTATCTAAGGWQLVRPVYVPAGTPAGTITAATIADVPAGAQCSVVQDADGANADAILGSTSISPASVVIASDATSTITVADEYVLPPVVTGDFAVAVVVSGAAAGQQGAIIVDAVCVQGADERRASFTVPAGATGTTTAGTLPSVPTGYACTVTQTADGATATATLASSTVTPASTTITGPGVATATLANVYAAVTPAPSPTPTPSRSGVLSGTGYDGGSVWLWGLGALAVGGVLVGADALRRRRARA